MKLKDSGWLEKLIKALKKWKKHAITYGFDSDESKAHGSDAMTLLFENAKHLDEYQRKFGASTISMQHISYFVSNADKFTSVEIKGMGGEDDYLAFCEDGFLITDFEKWQKNKVETRQETKSGNTGDTPVTLREFVRCYCEPLSDNLLESRVKSLLGLYQKKKIKLKHIKPYKKGQSKKFRPSYLMKMWLSYQKKLQSLPNLKQTQL